MYVYKNLNHWILRCWSYKLFIFCFHFSRFLWQCCIHSTVHCYLPGTVSCVGLLALYRHWQCEAHFSSAAHSTVSTLPGWAGCQNCQRPGAHRGPAHLCWPGVSIWLPVSYEAHCHSVLKKAFLLKDKTGAAPAPRRLGQEHGRKFKANLAYVVSWRPTETPCQKIIFFPFSYPPFNCSFPAHLQKVCFHFTFSHFLFFPFFPSCTSLFPLLIWTFFHFTISTTHSKNKIKNI